MTLKPQDILVVLKLACIGSEPWSYASLAVELGMSPSQVHSAVKRALEAQLAMRSGEAIVPNVRNLREFIEHGIKYVFVPDRGGMTRGMPTGYSAPPLKQHLGDSDEPPPVWPDAEGEVRGGAFSPLYHGAPKAAKADPRLYELLALVDAVRAGRARERSIAIKELEKRLRSYGQGN